MTERIFCPFSRKKCPREMGVGKDDHVVLERKSFIDFELGDSGKGEANEDDTSLTEKKQIIDAIGSKDTVMQFSLTPVEDLSNLFKSEGRSTSLKEALTVLLLKCVVNPSNWQKIAWASPFCVCNSMKLGILQLFTHLFRVCKQSNM